MAAYRRNRRRWRRGGRDTYPMRVAALLAGLLLVLLGTVLWAAIGGRRYEPMRVGSASGADAAEIEPTASARPGAVAPAEPPGGPAELDAAVSAGEVGNGGAVITAQADARVDAAETRPVVRTVAAPPPIPPRRPMAPGDTTAAGHAGLAEALLAAGDTAGAIVAYNAFLARNTDPDRERAVIAKLRELGPARQSGN